MKKKILAGVLVMVFVLASVMGVSAAGSKDGQVSVTQPSANAGYVIREGRDKFLNDKGTSDTSDDEFIANKDEILAYNAGTLSLDNLLGNATAVKNALKGKTALTEIFDLHDINGGTPVNGKHRVTINVPSLSSKCTGVKVLHYSMKDLKWETLDESTVDIAKKQVTVVSDDLSPIAIFATVSTGSGSGSSPATGMESATWMIFAAAAIVVAGVVVTRKKRA